MKRMSPRQTAHIGVVGAGIVGLTCAWMLIQDGHTISVVARELPGDVSTKWASPWAGAGIMPGPSDDPQDREMQLATLKHYWAIAHQDPTAGIQTVKVAEYWDNPNRKTKTEWYASVWPDFRHLDETELPPGTFSGATFTSLTINPDKYLPWIQKKLEQRGVVFKRAEVHSLEAAKTMLGCDAVVNASGLGALELANDEGVIGVRGQTMLVDPPKDTKSRTGRMAREIRIRRGKEYTYVIPRMNSGVIIGGISDEGNMNTEVSNVVKSDIINRVNSMTWDLFKAVDTKNVIKDIVGIRPDRKGGYRIEREGGIIHAYGFGGYGYRYSVGAGIQVAKLVGDLLSPKSKL